MKRILIALVATAAALISYPPGDTGAKMIQEEMELIELRPAYVYMAPSRQVPSGLMAQEDPVPPLGFGEDELVKEKMSEKEVKSLIASWIDRAEETYAGLFPPPDGFLDWLKKNPNIRNAFWQAVSPFYDDIPEAMRILNDLRLEDPNKVKKYYHLAIAFAVVWDTPDSIQSARWCCIWGMAPDQFEDLPALEDNWDYFTDPRYIRNFVLRPDQLAWPMLTHVVNMDLSKKERDWGIENYISRRKDLGPAYFDVQYDFKKLGRKPKLGQETYNLMNLKTFGGVCGDQSHFATRLSKLFGIPAMKVRGQGRGGGAGHAWYGAMKWARGKGTMVFSGRYWIQKYYVGAVFDPHTRVDVLDREIEMMLNGTVAYPEYISSLTLTRMARALMAEKPRQALNIVEHAIRMNYFCAPAWPLLMVLGGKTGADGERLMSKSDGGNWLNTMFKRLGNHPDLTVVALKNFMLTLTEDDMKQRDEFYRTADGIYKKNKRPDLRIKMAAAYGEELAARDEPDSDMRAIQYLIQSATENAADGRFIFENIMEVLHPLYEKNDMLDKAVDEYAKLVSNMTKMGITSAAQQIVKFYLIPALEALDRADEIPGWKKKYWLR